MDKDARRIASIPLDELLAPGGALEAELRRERTPAALLDWLESFNDEISASEENRKRLRLATGPIKLLFEEVRPLALFGKWLTQDHPMLTVEPVARKDKNYDGIIRSPNWAWPQKVEVTMATNGYQEHLRMRHLNQFGHAPAVGEIPFLREFGRTCVKEASPVAHESGALRRRAYELIRIAAERKLTKDYSPNTWLLIAFDDHVGFLNRGQPREGVLEEFGEFVRDCILTNAEVFEAVFVVGTSGTLVAGGKTIRN